MTPTTVAMLVFLAVVSLTFGLAQSPRSAMLEELAGTGQNPGAHLRTETPFLVRFVSVFSYRMIGQVSVLSWLVDRAVVRRAAMDRLLSQAGRPWGITAEDLIVATYAGTLGMASLGIIVAVLIHLSWFFGLAVGVVLGLYPQAVVKRMARNRADQIRRSLPSMLDLLVMAAEAGAIPTRGLRLVAEELEGPLGDEVRALVRQLGVAVDDVQAFVDLADRCRVEEVEEFAQALVTATKFSRMSYREALARQSERLRRALQQETEAQVRKLMVKVLLPLVVFFLPSVLILLIGPSLANLHGFL